MWLRQKKKKNEKKLCNRENLERMEGTIGLDIKRMLAYSLFSICKVIC